MLLGSGIMNGVVPGMVGNPGDYVFSNRGMDDVITRLMEQEPPKTKPPAPEEVIEALPRRPATAADVAAKGNCAICKDDFAEGDALRELPCHHDYHDDCIVQWLRTTGSCPVCRLVLEAREPAPDP